MSRMWCDYHHSAGVLHDVVIGLDSVYVLLLAYYVPNSLMAVARVIPCRTVCYPLCKTNGNVMPVELLAGQKPCSVSSLHKA